MNVEEVERIAALARIELSAEEKRRFAEQLTSILGYFEKLRELDTSGVPPLAHSPDLRGPLREDVPRTEANPVELLRLSKGCDEPFFVVPRILD